MKQAIWLLVLVLAACAPRAPQVPVANQPPATGTCRVGPDGGRPIADRGIGGTGAPGQMADRGIGGTGIIGVITGFASVCIAGEEVALPPAVTAEFDGVPGSLDDLRAGQLAALRASGPPDALQASHIDVRHVVVGQVQGTAASTMTVAGQAIAIGDAAGNGVNAYLGQWVAVSGIRRPDGTIEATRIDITRPGRTMVRGLLFGGAGQGRIGALEIVIPKSASLPPSGWPVVVTGTMQDGVLIADTVNRDVAADSPTAYFGPTVENFIIETDVAIVAGGFMLNRDFVSGRGFGDAGTRQRAVAVFSRGSSGFVAKDLRFEDSSAPGGFTSAPAFPGAGNGRGGYPGFSPSGGFSPGGLPAPGGAFPSFSPPGGFQPGGLGAPGGAFPNFSPPGGFAPAGPPVRH